MPTAASSAPENPQWLACRVLLHRASDGAWNMAVNEALLEAAAADGVATLRFYQWSAPTLSLGYFQAVADRSQHPPSLSCTLVRRASGGGAILHDRELTYSLAVPTQHRWAADPRRLYLATHEALAFVLHELGIAARLSRESAPRNAAQPFLCFQRRAVGDLLLDGAKIAGSAQRRQRGAILQHGSILLAASPCAPELSGLAELSGQQIAADSLAISLQTALGERLNLHWVDSPLGDSIVRRGEQLVREKFASPAWTLRR